MEEGRPIPKVRNWFKSKIQHTLIVSLRCSGVRVPKKTPMPKSAKELYELKLITPEDHFYTRIWTRKPISLLESHSLYDLYRDHVFCMISLVGVHLAVGIGTTKVLFKSGSKLCYGFP